MAEIVIYGAGDDLIEIEATDFRNEEFNVGYAEYQQDGEGASLLLAVSDGTILRVRYDEDGIWRFTPSVVGSSSVDIVPGVDDKRHSDRVTLTGDDLRWVVLGTEIAK
jgi:hypothetical protein